jgi:anaerobic ribonucleoside-triphosphate reductase
VVKGAIHVAAEKLEDLLPQVIRKGKQNQEIVEKFNASRIYDSLLEDTSATKDEAQKITTEVVRLLMRLNLPRLTGPMIRELTCTILLQLGFEKYRYQYTRVGFPMKELENLIARTDKAKLPQVVLDQVLFEFNAVKSKITSNAAPKK